MKFTDPQSRPKFAAPLFENIPQELRERPQWVLFRMVWNKHSKQWAKVPFDAQTLTTAKSDDPTTWASFDAVQAVYVEGKAGFDGIGFVFSVDDPYFGADFDNCIKDEKIDPSVTEWIDQFDSYTEKSVSETGLHVIGKGVVGDGIKTGDSELYDRGRYFTFSGNVGRRKQIEYRQVAVESFKKFLRPEVKAQTPQRPALTQGGPSVPAVLERAFGAENGASLRTLYEGGMNGHKSPSEAIASLCWKFAFWCDRDPSLLDAVVRGSRLCDSKWDSRRGKQTWGSP